MATSKNWVSAGCEEPSTPRSFKSKHQQKLRHKEPGGQGDPGTPRAAVEPHHHMLQRAVGSQGGGHRKAPVGTSAQDSGSRAAQSRGCLVPKAHTDLHSYSKQLSLKNSLSHSLPAPYSPSL